MILPFSFRNGYGNDLCPRLGGAVLVDDVLVDRETDGSCPRILSIEKFSSDRWFSGAEDTS